MSIWVVEVELDLKQRVFGHQKSKEYKVRKNGAFLQIALENISIKIEDL